MGSKRIKQIVCLGGGIGTVNLLSGLKKYPAELTAVVSMADDGGSSGRLRRLYGMYPPGDVVSCLAALLPQKHPLLSQLLTYRFAGDRYGKDTELGGHKLGNLILAALLDIKGDFVSAIREVQSLFSIPGNVLPATAELVSISAKTTQDRYVYGEEKIDLGKYQGKRILEEVFVHPANPKATPEVIEKILSADIVILGPGDLYTAQLPVIIVPEIAEAVKKTKAKKLYICNIANKPFETRGYKVKDYIDAVVRHIGSFPFETIFLNTNFSEKIPKKFHYHYVKNTSSIEDSPVKVVSGNFVRKDFPLYHDSAKLAKAVWETV